MANLDQAATQALDDVNALVSGLDQTEEQIDFLKTGPGPANEMPQAVHQRVRVGPIEEVYLA